MGSANDGVRFLLELAVLFAAGGWGFSRYRGIRRWLLGLGVPVAIAAVWATFVNPDGSSALGDPARLGLELAVFGTGAAALAWRNTGWAVAFAAIVAVHLGLTFPLDQR